MRSTIRSEAWAESMAHRVMARVRRSARLRWGAAAATVLFSAGGIVLPRGVHESTILEVAVTGAPPPPAKVARLFAAPAHQPVQVRLQPQSPKAPETGPVEIMF